MTIRFNPAAAHDGRLGVTAADFDTLKAALGEVVAANGEDVFDRHLEAVRSSARDPLVRVRWDAFWTARRRFPINPDTGGPDAFRDATDAHISTALNRLLPVH